MEKSGQSSAKPFVVVVDDDAAVRNSLKFSLEIEGFAVRVFPAGTELLNATDLDECVCCIIDQNMPGLSGLNLIAKLRDRRLPATIILITSHPNAAVRERAALAGVPIIEK